ncbi:MAG: tyrosine-type recombinase/integrase [Thermoleophilia bacterium]
MATLVDPPRGARFKPTPLTLEQARAFLDAVKGDRLEAFYTVAVALGLRRGEALALRWQDIDLKSRTLSVRHTLQNLQGGGWSLAEPKSRNSRRTLGLPNFAVLALKDHRQRQLKERMTQGSHWQDHGFVFASEVGTPLDGNNVYKRYKALLKENSLPDIRFHDLRHTAGTLLCILGVHYSAAIDAYGDGTNVIQKDPDTTITNSVDFTPPAQVSNLAVTSTTSGSASVAFTAPGDDDNTGTATAYDLRYSTSTIMDQDWQDAVPASGMPAPLSAGSTQTITVNGLNPGTTYYFALKATDEMALQSPLSNVASVATTIPNLTWGINRIYWASWTDYVNRQLSIDYNLRNIGTGIATGVTVAASYGNPTSVYVTTPLPLTVGDITPNSFSTVTIKYYVPTSVGSFTTTTYANCQDDTGRTYWFPGPMP